MLEKINRIDTELLFFFNGLHTSWLDSVMFFLTKAPASIPVYLLLAYLIIKEYQIDSWIIFVCIGVCILMTDQITSGLMKPFFERLRPTHEPSLKDLIHIVKEYRGGKYGFASSHAANTFGIAMLLWLLFKKQYHWISWLFAWAVLISFTRVYLGVHYPSDILAGAIIGVTCGTLSFYLARKLLSRFSRHYPSERLNQSDR